MNQSILLAAIVDAAIKYYDKTQIMLETGLKGKEFVYETLTASFDARGELFKAIKEFKTFESTKETQNG